MKASSRLTKFVGSPKDDKMAPDGYHPSKLYNATVLNPFEQRRKNQEQCH